MSFLENYFINPILNSEGYNTVNTITYVLLAIIVIYSTSLFFNKMKIKTDYSLVKKFVLIIILGGLLRALQDSSFFASIGGWQYLFVTPMLYIMLYIFSISLIIIDKKFNKNIFWVASGILLAIFGIVFLLKIRTIFPLLIIFILFIIFIILTKAFDRRKILQKENIIVFSGQLLDACSSVTAVEIIGGYTEQHIVPKLLFSFIPFEFFILLKIALTLLALYYIDKEVENTELKFLIKIGILMVGLGPGTRNTLTMLI